ncbi:O-antigen ligase family protein [Duganella sp. P38]|uniref:O-antigen ligase family protein n=1 Tax=Duganella sp. P38 TaxID=3423949 RepID=UPI003D7B5388
MSVSTVNTTGRRLLPAVKPRAAAKRFDWAGWIVPAAFAYAFILAPISSLRGAAAGAGTAINMTTADGSTGNKLMWIMLGLVTLYAWVTREDRSPRAVGWPMLLLAGYLLLAVASFGWSAVPGISLRRSVQQVLVVAVVLVPFLIVNDVQKMLLRVTWVLAAAVVLSVLVMPLAGVPAFGYRGFYGQKNAMGQVAVISFYFFIYGFLCDQRTRQRVAYAFLLLAAAGLCVLSKSKTSMALMALMPLGALFIVATSRLKLALARIGVGLGAAFVLVGLVFAVLIIPITLADVSNFLFHDTTFTGRTRIWAFADYYIGRAPWFGHGYGSFWGVGSATKALNEGFIGGLLQAHNGYLDILLENGRVGLILLVTLVLTLVWALFRLTWVDGKLAFLLVSSLMFVLLNNTMESSLMRGYVPLWMTFLVCTGAASTLRLRRPAAAGASTAGDVAGMAGRGVVHG